MAQRMVSEPRPGQPADWSGLAGAPPVEERSVKTDAAIYTGGVYVAQALMFLAGLLQKGLLGPAGTGFWALMQTFWTFLMIAPLGVNQGTARQIPLYRGRRDYAGAAAVADTGGSFSLAAVAVAGLTVAATSAIFGGRWAPELQWGLVCLGLLAPIQFLSNYHEGLIQATKRWNVASVNELIKAITALTVTTAAVLWLGFYGMFVGALMTHVLLFASWKRLGFTSWRRPAFHWRMDMPRMRELLSFGAPIMLSGQLWYLLLAIPNLMVAAVLDARQLGYFALAVSVTGYLLHLPRSIGAAIFPRMTERFAESGDIAEIRHYATDTQRLLGYVLVPLFIGAAFCLFPVIVRLALPEFEPAIPVVHIMVAGSFFVALVNMPVKLLITAGLRWQLTPLYIVCLVINGAANAVALIVLDWGLEGAAAATAFSYFMTFAIMTGYSMSRTLGWRDAATQIVELSLVLAYVVGALWGLESLIGTGAGSPAYQIAVGVLQFACFVVAMAPWLFVAEKRYKAVTTIGRLLGSGVRRISGRR